MSKPLIISEGSFLDDNDNLITSYFVDLRDPKDRLPITTLTKGCRKEHALESCKTIRISKPAKFRNIGESLISDPSEMNFSRIEEDSVVVDDPNDLAEAQLLNDEQNRAAGILQSGSSVTTKSTKRSRKSTHSLSFGKNGWIFCTSIEPLDQEEQNRWWKALDDDYDHVSYIYRTREFVRSLGSMVTEQLGPQGREHESESRFGNLDKIRTHYRTQAIFHGPVIYVDDPYEVISNVFSKIELMFLPVFIKGLEYQDQREYRFSIWTEEEPSDQCVDLNITPAMLGSLQERPTASSQQTVLVELASDRNSNSQVAQLDPVEESAIEETQEPSEPPDGKRPYHSLMDIVTDPSTPISPHSYTGADLPEDLHEKTTTYSALRTLRMAVEGFSGKRKTEAASSAWHAEPRIRSLCSKFEDPIKNISINDDNFVVVAVKFSKESRSKAHRLSSALEVLARIRLRLTREKCVVGVKILGNIAGIS